MQGCIPRLLRGVRSTSVHSEGCATVQLGCMEACAPFGGKTAGGFPARASVPERGKTLADDPARQRAGGKTGASGRGGGINRTGL